MRILRGTGARGLAGIAPAQKAKHLVRPLLTTTRQEIEAYLKAKGQSGARIRPIGTSRHTRNRIRHTLLPLLEQDFNPAIRQTLADLAELAQAEEEYWNNAAFCAVATADSEGKPSRSGRSSSGEAQGVLALDLAALRGLPLAVQRQVHPENRERLGVSLEFQAYSTTYGASGARDKPGCKSWRCRMV